ncbi:NUDIX domain-containing protein [Pseudanabaena sp. 'Roaring Creek']|uniref:NUDIX domain-containing protein n=1 Tax=Pseudanabaena sp. 'Roaring Creek' TaxID=1681830 RepID=UPI0006D806A6|nr:NUDIX domain-containing protein [Pseudanabaena sp. 'Roaring Creek']
MNNPIRLRVTVNGLFVDAEEVLLIHQMTLPEVDCWDLPGGGLEADEMVLDGLRREIREETGIASFDIKQLLTVTDSFFPDPIAAGGLLHNVNIIYLCSVDRASCILTSSDPEIGAKGIQWIPINAIDADMCSIRCWQALSAL